MNQPKYKLVSFDMDSTLIQAECIDEIAKEAGVGEQVAAVTERAMRGELDFTQSLRERVAQLAGLDESVLEQVYRRIELMPGAEALCAALREQGIHMAILSGGFTFFAERFAERLGIDHLAANELEIVEGKLTGRVVGDIVDAQAKATHLQARAQYLGVPMDQTAAIGDGANDLKVMQAAGLGIAFCAKPIVQEQADAAIAEPDLMRALPLLGLEPGAGA